MDRSTTSGETTTMGSIQTRRTARLKYHRTDSHDRLCFRLVDKAGDDEGSVMVQKTMWRNLMQGFDLEKTVMTIVLEQGMDT